MDIDIDMCVYIFIYTHSYIYIYIYVDMYMCVKLQHLFSCLLVESIVHAHTHTLGRSEGHCVSPVPRRFSAEELPAAVRGRGAIQRPLFFRSTAMSAWTCCMTCNSSDIETVPDNVFARVC